MDSITELPFLATGLAVGFACAFLWLRSTVDASKSRSEIYEQEIRSAQAQVNELLQAKATFEERASRVVEIKTQLGEKEEFVARLQAEIVELREKSKQLETLMSEKERSYRRDLQRIEEAEKRLTDCFSSLSSSALDKNNQRFLELAKEQFQAFNKETTGDLEKKKVEIDKLVEPLRDSLEKVDRQISELERNRQGAYEVLSEQVKSLVETQTKLQKETNNLVSALRNPSQRGKWGEITLRRVVEAAGMVKYCHFDEQVTNSTESGNIRPDMRVYLPGGKFMVVDSKVPLEAYQKAIECEDEQERDAHYLRHALQLKKHIVSLGTKAYSAQFDQAPDFVILFLPAEPLFTTAMERDRTLFDLGASNKVFIATPMTLIAMLRAVAYGWQQERVAERAQEISKLGGEIVDRIRIVADKMDRVGRSLNGAMTSYNEAASSMERNLLTTAKKLQSKGAGENLTLPDALVDAQMIAKPFLKPELQSLPSSEIVQMLADPPSKNFEDEKLPRDEALELLP